MSEKTREDVTAEQYKSCQDQQSQPLHSTNGHLDGCALETDVTSGGSAEGAEPAANSDVDEAPVKKSKRKKLLYIGAGALIVAVIAGLAYWLYARQFESTDDATVQADITQISPKVSAYRQEDLRRWKSAGT